MTRDTVDSVRWEGQVGRCACAFQQCGIHCDVVSQTRGYGTCRRTGIQGHVESTRALEVMGSPVDAKIAEVLGRVE